MTQSESNFFILANDRYSLITAGRAGSVGRATRFKCLCLFIFYQIAVAIDNTGRLFGG